MCLEKTQTKVQLCIIQAQESGSIMEKRIEVRLPISEHG
jgi:hypothetical protein